ncbi:hypothetical protein GCM10007989_14600 [Devosia pacifica]|uniref:Uncharacterized protein n=1 Tax=Devosia pacifica TaxID=1335967 RepID=A0A918S2I0_9HYPH|nr:hypothetical protein [Devosia pacifica]GHA20575.1 hypothetical protein GCM10007989_14600 [Devosia pacifica]
MQERNVDESASDRPIVIEVRGEPVGVIVNGDAGFRFLAVRLPAFAIDGETFESIEAAQRAAAEAVFHAET